MTGMPSSGTVSSIHLASPTPRTRIPGSRASAIPSSIALGDTARWTGDLDMRRLQQSLDHPTLQESQDPEAILDLQVTHMAVTPAKR